MNPDEFADLHRKAQLRYGKFCQGLMKNRRREQRTMATIAVSKNIVEVMEAAPDLHSYNPSEDW